MRASRRLMLQGVILLAALWTRSAPAAAHWPKPASGADWQYRFLEEKTLASFDLRFRVDPKEMDEPLAVRVFFGESGRDGAFVEIGPQGAFRGVVRDGEETRGKVDDPTPLRKLAGMEIVVEQRPHRWSLCANGRILAGGEESFGERRPIGFGVVGGDADIRDLRFQAVPDLFFTDTFMRTGNDPTSWSELGGKWSLKTISNPLLSANAFQYIATGGAADASGIEKWTSTDAGFTVNFHPGKSGAIEIPMGYCGPQDLCLFRWSGPIDPAPESKAVKQFIRRQGVKETVLAETAGGYTPDQTYALVVASAGEDTTLTLDGAPLFKLRTGDLPARRLSLYLSGASIVGEWFWSDIRYAVACRPAKRGAAGVYLCYRSPQDYYLFRWAGRDAERPVRQIIRRQGEVETVLAESPGGYTPDQWYTITSTVGSGWVEVALDDKPALRVYDNGLTYGKIGLYVEGEQPASFDDVVVENHRAALLDFSRAKTGAFLITGGQWLQVAPDADRDLWSGGLVAQAAEPARLLFGSARWRNYAVSARLGPWGAGMMGLCFRYQDELNYYAARVCKGETPVVELVRLEDGRERLLASAPIAGDAGGHRLNVTLDGDAIVVALDGMPLLRAADNALLTGRVGLYAGGVEGAAFSDVLCEFPPARKPINTTHEAFSGEESMQAWSGAMSDWEKKSAVRPDGQPPVEVAWHRSNFHGDVSLEVRLDSPPGPESEVGLALNGNGADLNAGFTARLVRRSGAEKALEVELLSGGKSVATAPLAWESGPLILGLSRAGDMVSIRARGESLLSCRDADEAPGRRIGWYALKAPVKVADIDIYTDNLIDYAFNTAPTDWRMASGIWEVTNKWTCDPRWSFFSGRSEQDAVLWNKRPLRGDFTIEFYVGNKMDATRGNAYQYAQDMDITVCADGHNLTSGYSFLFGGFDNTFTGIYRGVQRWGTPETPLLIERSGNLHRRWYHIAVSRKGQTLELRVDDKLVVSIKDPNPLTGTQWALWTHNNGLMFARVRVIAEGIGDRESSDLTHPAVAQSVYSN